MNTCPFKRKLRHSLGMEVEGYYRLQVRKASDHSLVRELGPFNNIITDAALNFIGSNTDNTKLPGKYCYVGTGTTAGAAGDQTMQVWLATKNTPDTVQVVRNASSPYWVEQVITYRFGVGTATGNLTEVGVGWLNANGATPGPYLWSRSLIVDGGGSPITLTVLADEYLDVIYTLRLTPPTSDVVGSFIYNSTTYGYTCRARNVGGWGVNIATSEQSGGFSMTRYMGGPCTLDSVLNNALNLPGATAGETAFAGRYSRSAYVANSKKTTTVLTLGPGDANFAGGIVGMYGDVGSVYPGVFTNCAFQFVLATALPKTGAAGLSLSFSLGWDRI